jgi:hypothetical protein
VGVAGQATPNRRDAYKRGRDIWKESLPKNSKPAEKEAAQWNCAASRLVPFGGNNDSRGKWGGELPVGHFLGHVQDEFAITLFHFAQQAAKLVEKACFFPDAAPGDIVG